MSVFGQVWVFSAVAFVLGAFLAWLFLVRPAQKRIGELQRRLAAAEGSPRPRTGPHSTRIAPAPGAAGGDRGDVTDREDTPATPPTRHFEPASAPRPEEVTEHIAPSPSWLERDSLQGSSGAGTSEIDSLDEEFLRADDLDDRDAEHGSSIGSIGSIDGALDDLRGSTGGVLDAPSPSDPGEPTQIRGRDGELDLGGERSDTGSGKRKGNSLFEPAPLDDEPEEEPLAFGQVGQGADEPRVESATALPKRQPGRSQLESFDSAKPLKPSMRQVERRDPEPSRSGSLFEPTVPPSNSAPPARDVSAASDLPPGPFGPGSAMPEPGGGRPSEEFTVKASVTALRYCAEGSPEYPRMVAEVWFRTPADAERVGFRPLSAS